ncbi:MAG: hypothetical protein HC799_19295 [Limnothrix sp. RL_2_0]|nr:hypothetical protein [Limnothrix sp. RL_2_0]
MYYFSLNFSFHPYLFGTTEIITLSAKDELLEFLPRLTTMTQMTQVAVRGWSVEKKESIVAIAKAAKETNKMGGQTLGVAQVAKIKGFDDVAKKASHTIISEPVTTPAEADLLSAGQLKDMAIAFITAEGSNQGLAELRAGKTIKITNAGKQFRGILLKQVYLVVRS